MRDQPARELEIERRKRERLIADDLDRGPAAAEHDDRSKGRIVRNARDQFARFRPQDHRMDGHAGDAGIRSHGMGSGKNIRNRVAHRALAGEIEPHAADFGFVNDIRREDFHHHARSFRQERPRRCRGFSPLRASSAGAIGIE